MNAKDKLQSIAVFGTKVYHGNNTYSIKWNYSIENARVLFRYLKSKVPNFEKKCLFYKNSKNGKDYIVLGGTFGTKSKVFEYREEWKNLQRGE